MSFAQEMKDFVSAWTAVNEMGVGKKKLDLQKEEIENLKAYRDASLALEREQFELTKKNADRNYALAAKRNSAAAAPNEAKQMNAVFESLEGLQDANFDWDPEGATQAIPTGEPAYRRGGLVAHAAQGGLIEEDPDLPFVDPQNPYVDPAMNEEARRMAIPTEPVAPQPAGPRPVRAAGLATPTAQPEAPAAEPDPKATESVASGAEAAISDAAPALVEDAKKKPTAVGPDAETERMDIVTNKGGLSMAEYKELITTIDPNDSIPAYLKSATVLATTHRYFMENGQPEKAQRIAKGILILNKQMSQTLGALAQNAMEEGNVPAAAQLVTDAANQFPTGHQFKVTPNENGLTYTVMKNGEEAGSGELTTEQLWELTGKVKDGSLFISEMGRIAGSQSKKVGPTQALELTANAYTNAKQSKEALELAMEEGVEGEELNRLRTAASNAAKTYQKFRGNALQMGLKPADINAANKDAEELALPMTEQPEDGYLSAQEAGVTSDGNIVEFDDMPAPKNRAERDALPPGTKYVAPDGSVRTR